MSVRQVLLIQQHPLVPFLILALLAHALVILAIKIIKPVPTQTPFSFEVQLMSMKHPEIANASPTIQTMPTISKKIPLKANAMTPKTRIRPIMSLKENTTPASIHVPALPELKTDVLTLKGAEKSLEHPIETQTQKNNVTTDDLLNTARRIAQEDALTMPKEKSDGITLADREFSPQLAKAMSKMKKLPAGTYQFGNGMMKIIGIDGSVYCLAPPPSSAMSVSALNAQISMPMTCPNE